MSIYTGVAVCDIFPHTIVGQSWNFLALGLHLIRRRPFQILFAFFGFFDFPPRILLIYALAKIAQGHLTICTKNIKRSEKDQNRFPQTLNTSNQYNYSCIQFPCI